ncbi:Gfo/Idh/MocA family protein [Verrucomicrobiota bacterium]
MRFVQVGVGGFGRVWIDVLHKDRRVKMVGLVDLNKQALEKVCSDYGYDESICFTSLARALKETSADALVCSTPPSIHREQVVAGLRAGLHVISEKPMAESMTDCKAMLAAARKTGSVYVVSQNYRYAPEMHTIAELVEKGAIGKIGQVKLDFYKGCGFGGFRAQMDYPLLVDMSIHHFDLVRYLTGLDPVSVRGEAWNPSWSHFKGDCSCSVVFTMSNNARVLYNGSWCAKGDYCDWNGNWIIEGTKGTILYRNGVITLNSVPDAYAVVKSREVTKRKMRRTGQSFVLDNFIKCVKSGARPYTDVQDNIQSVAMVFGAVKAVRTGRKVSL